MSPTVLPSAPRERGLDGRQVLAAMLAFFGVVLAVNGVMLYLALSTHSGIVAQEPYRKGLAYNARIAADERQAALGWSATVDIQSSGRVLFSLADGEARPVTGLAITGRLARPASSRGEMALRFAEHEHVPGTYVAEAGPIAAGAWQADVEARDGQRHAGGADEPVFRARRRLWLKP